MPGSVAVSPELSPFADALRQQGFQVVDLPRAPEKEVPHGVDAVVVTGASRGLLGVWNTDPSVPIVDADGKTPEDVADEIRQLLGAR